MSAASAIAQPIVHASIPLESVWLPFHADLTHLLSLEERLSSTECVDVIKFMANFCNGDFDSKHVNYLLLKNELPGSGVVQTLSCDLSDFSWKKIIKQNILEYTAVKVILSQGVAISVSDIDFILIECKENVQLLELIVMKCTPKPSQDDLLRWSEHALKHKKFNIVLVLLSHGANIDVARIAEEMTKSDVLSNKKIISHLKSTVEGRIALFFRAVKYSEYALVESLLSDGENKSVVSRISISSVLGFPLQGNSVARQGYITFVKSLLERGVNPNREGESSPLDIVLKLPNEYQAEKVELLTLLLQHGAAIEHQRENETTILHIATKFVIDSGRSSFLACHITVNAMTYPE